MKNILLFCSPLNGKKAPEGGGCEGMRDTEGERQGGDKRSGRQKEIWSEERWRVKAFSYAKASSCHLRH